MLPSGAGGDIRVWRLQRNIHLLPVLNSIRTTLSYSQSELKELLEFLFPSDCKRLKKKTTRITNKMAINVKHLP
jgi:hypothetical protein